MFADCLYQHFEHDDRFDVSVQSFHELRASPPCNGSLPHIVMLDSSIGEHCGRTTIDALRAEGVETIVLFVPDTDRPTVQDSILADVDGCVLEESSLQSLLEATDTVLSGKRWFSPEIQNEMIALNQDLCRSLPDQREPCGLTAREIEVMQLIAWERLSNKQIARKLCVSVYTVKNHVHNVIEKLNVTDRFEAAEYAERKRWLSLVPGRAG